MPAAEPGPAPLRRALGGIALGAAAGVLVLVAVRPEQERGPQAAGGGTGAAEGTRAQAREEVDQAGA